MSIEKTKNGSTRERWEVKNFKTNPPKDEHFFLAIYPSAAYGLMRIKKAGDKTIIVDTNGDEFGTPERWISLPTEEVPDNEPERKSNALEKATA